MLASSRVRRLAPASGRAPPSGSGPQQLSPCWAWENRGLPGSGGGILCSGQGWEPGHILWSQADLRPVLRQPCARLGVSRGPCCWPLHTQHLPSPPLSHPIFWRKNPSEHCCSLFSSPGKHSLLTLSEPHLLPLPRGDLILSGGGICEVQKPSTLSAQGSSLTNHYYRCLRSGLRAAEGPALQGGPGCVPDRSQLSMRFRSASTQKSLPSTLSTTRATGRMRPVVKRTSRSVPSRAARSILAARSCMLVKYRYLQERAGEGRAPHPVPRPGLSLPSTKETSPDPLGIQ